MGTDTKIEWADHSASPWHGCSEAHLGCDNCYAREMSVRNPGTLGVWGDNGTRVKSKSFIKNCKAWNERALIAGRIDTVFPSICDPFEDRSELEPWRREMFETIDKCPNLRFLLLTKRPGNVRKMVPVCGTDILVPIEMHRLYAEGQLNGERWKHPNVHILYSASDQQSLEAGSDDLIACRDLCAGVGLSLEPLVGPVDLREYIRRIDWVIVGGESGPYARPCNVAWIREIVCQCAIAGVPCYVKQLGANPVCRWRLAVEANLDGQIIEIPGEENMYRIRFRDKKGGDISEWPEDLRVRQYQWEGNQ